MSISNQILGIISRNPGVTLNEIIENCTNKEYAQSFLKDLIDKGQVRRVDNSSESTYYIRKQ